METSRSPGFRIFVSSWTTGLNNGVDNKVSKSFGNWAIAWIVELAKQAFLLFGSLIVGMSVEIVVNSNNNNSSSNSSHWTTIETLFKKIESQWQIQIEFIVEQMWVINHLQTLLRLSNVGNHSNCSFFLFLQKSRIKPFNHPIRITPLL